ncbi:MAG: leucine-rich repeat-containing protein [Candidatus Magnetoglobus multicellularis str. Araruama]|uniref:Leucine-rich repeat-containing protein n=1 Tax=Candidatus Magnetoglobus multicellularis str. Araruama TaxID=890399 RepID=A0A1V1PFR5_9BACT|nr:MAG: leucine-rich repeat-containing protein [Candidatus Magnetoglobus multicellularis str. Araruama]
MKFLSSNYLKHFLLIVIMLFSNADSVIAVSQTEREALIVLYDSTDGVNWEENTNWLGNSGTECSWFGITCESDNVIRISLSNNKLSGTIPAELGQLTLLHDLFLNENQLTGNIPAELAQLSKLQYLFLENNMLTGNIPAAFGQLSDLNSLWLQNNRLTGNIPKELGQLSNLISLVLSNNQLSGRIPAELAQLPFLIDLNLFNNQLTGVIPYSIIHLTNLINDSTNDGLDLRTDFRKNALHASDSDLLVFLSQKQYATDWQSSQNILNVCQTCPHTSIQSAINAASHTATTIVVHDGTYIENVEFPEKKYCTHISKWPRKNNHQWKQLRFSCYFKYWNVTRCYT